MTAGDKLAVLDLLHEMMQEIDLRESDRRSVNAWFKTKSERLALEDSLEGVDD